jgi:drug/metabolite transporter (DMT)-like permease
MILQGGIVQSLSVLDKQEAFLSNNKVLTLKIFIFLALVNMLETAVQFCYKKAALSQASFSPHGFMDILHFVALMTGNPYFLCGLFFAFFLFCIWVTVLSRVDLSVAVPLTSLSYVLIPVVSIVLFAERISMMRWMGSGLLWQALSWFP